MADYQMRGSSQMGKPTGTLVVGTIILGMGVLWMLDNLGLADASTILRWWPALLLLFGLARLTGIGTRHNPVSGGIFTFAGGWLLLGQIGLVHRGLFAFWPLFLIFAGGSVVWRAMRGSAAPALDGGDVSSFPRPFALMGGVSMRAASEALRGAEANAVMGGIELDLRGARLAEPKVAIEVFAMWGGIEILVPTGWRVITEVTPIMGGFEDATIAPEDANAPQLVIRGFAVMGGIEVRHGGPGGKNRRRESIIVERDSSGRRRIVVEADPDDRAPGAGTPPPGTDLGRGA